MKKVFVVIATVVIAFLTLSGVGICSSISGIHFSPDSPSALPFGENVDISFSYSTTEAGGIRIFARPMTNGSTTPGYGASGSPLYPAGSGSGSGSFTITGGETTVDQIRFQVYNSDQSALLSEFFVPVIFHFHAAATSITDIEAASPSPASLAYGQNVDITFNYSTAQAGGIRIFARPMTNGATTPGYGASGSPLYPAGSGSGSGSFTITGGETTVDQIRFQVYNSDQSALLSEFFVPVRYAFPVKFASAPAAPTLIVSKSGGNVTLSWTSVPTASGYLIGYAPYPGGEYIEVLDVGNKTSFSFNLFAGSVGYYVVVVPYNDNGWGALSNVGFFNIP